MKIYACLKDEKIILFLHCAQRSLLWPPRTAVTSPFATAASSTLAETKRERKPGIGLITPLIVERFENIFLAGDSWDNVL